MPHKTPIHLYKGEWFSKHHTKRKPSLNVVTIDFDETIGSFVDLERLWLWLQCYQHTSLSTDAFFNQLIALYPEFLRYGILHILYYLYKKKCSGECHKLYIYTNNQSSSEWISRILRYIDHKLHICPPLFDQIIRAFKINNKPVELGRTTHQKTRHDFIRCTLLPEETEICFIDDTYYPGMQNERVYYIHPRGYVHNLSLPEMIDRFWSSDIGKQQIELFQLNYEECFQFMCEPMMKDQDPAKCADYQIVMALNKLEMDIRVSQKIMYHLREFFYLTRSRMKTEKILRLRPIPRHYTCKHRSR